jgi:hypothetical protein
MHAKFDRLQCFGWDENPADFGASRVSRGMENSVAFGASSPSGASDAMESAAGFGASG